MSHPRAAALIRDLGLAPHPEGGFYAEVFRSSSRIATLDARGQRDALTTIYFLLEAGAHSRWHRVTSDEVWHFYEGDLLDLLVAAPDLSSTRHVRLGPVTGGQQPVFTVPAGWWQAARPVGGYSLAGCTVGPGFDFRDFTFLRDVPDAAQRLSVARQDWISLL